MLSLDSEAKAESRTRLSRESFEKAGQLGAAADCSRRATAVAGGLGSPVFAKLVQLSIIALLSSLSSGVKLQLPEFPKTKKSSEAWHTLLRHCGKSKRGHMSFPNESRWSKRNDHARAPTATAEEAIASLAHWNQ